MSGFYTKNVRELVASCKELTNCTQTSPCSCSVSKRYTGCLQEEDAKSKTKRSWYDFLINGRFSVGSSDRHNIGSHRSNLIYLVCYWDGLEVPLSITSLGAKSHISSFADSAGYSSRVEDDWKPSYQPHFQSMFVQAMVENYRDSVLK